MAKQKGIIRLEGTIGGISFMKTEDGYIAKEKTEISAEKIKNDAAFIRTRENNSEFGNAGKAVKLIRSAFQEEMQSAKDSKLTSRLQKQMMKVVKADQVSERGLRNAATGELGFLKGFEFNRNAELGSALYAPYDTVVDRAAGILQVKIARFIPKVRIVPPAGATHFELISAGAEIDFAEGLFVKGADRSGILKWNSDPTADMNLTNSVPSGSVLPLLLVLGIQFFQMVNGTPYTLNNGAFNALSLIRMDIP